MSERFNVNIMTISKWKSEFIENSTKVFENGSSVTDDKEKEIEHLHTKIGLYYCHVGESEENLEIMKLIDAYHIEHPLDLQTFRTKS